MSSSEFYTRIEPTDNSGLALIASLTGSDVNALRYAGSLVRNGIITLSGAAATYTLLAQDFVQAAIGVQLVNASGISASTANMYVGADAASVAAQYINLFQLTSGSGGKVLVRFQVDQADNAAQTVNLSNTSGTNTYVAIKLDNSASAATQVLFTSAADAGVQSCVEVWATNITSGSQAVVFNVVQ